MRHHTEVAAISEPLGYTWVGILLLIACIIISIMWAKTEP